MFSLGLFGFVVVFRGGCLKRAEHMTAELPCLATASVWQHDSRRSRIIGLLSSFGELGQVLGSKSITLKVRPDYVSCMLIITIALSHHS